MPRSLSLLKLFSIALSVVLVDVLSSDFLSLKPMLIGGRSISKKKTRDTHKHFHYPNDTEASSVMNQTVSTATTPTPGNDVYGNDDQIESAKVYSATVLKRLAARNDSIDLPLSTNKPSSTSAVKLTNKQAVFLHIGKAAGGTFADRSRNVWKILFPACHPSLCERATQFNTTKLILTIRDPVDRFVSAFYWRTWIICNPQGDSRKVSSAASHDPAHLCKANAPDAEKQLLFGPYYQDVNRLARDLCSNDTNKTALLVQQIQQLQHAQSHIVDWLNFDWDPENMFAYVLEPAANVTVDDQIDASIVWVYDNIRFENPAVFQERALRAMATPTTGQFAHSSKATKQALTPENEKCIAELYRKDYELLRDAKHLICKTRDCLKGIQSILSRRSFLFETTSSTG